MVSNRGEVEKLEAQQDGFRRISIRYERSFTFQAQIDKLDIRVQLLTGFSLGLKRSKIAFTRGKVPTVVALEGSRRRPGVFFLVGCV
jgi:hypothetical protein